MDENSVTSGSKTRTELLDALREMVTEDGYKCLIGVVFYPNGAKLVIHGAPNMEIEADMLRTSIMTLCYRLNDVRVALHAATLREEKNGTN